MKTPSFQNSVITIYDKSLDDLKEPRLQELRSICLPIPSMKKCPKADVKPEALGRHLTHITLINQNDQGHLYVRLVGEEIRNVRLGYIRDALLKDITPDYYAEMLTCEYTRALKLGKAFAQDVLWDYENRILHVERLIIPVERDVKDSVQEPQILVSTARSQSTKSYMQADRDFELKT